MKNIKKYQAFLMGLMFIFILTGCLSIAENKTIIKRVPKQKENATSVSKNDRVDRFEESYAVFEKEDGTMLVIEKNDLPSTAKEGDVLSIDNNKITINIVETERRRKEIEKSIDDLWE